MANDAAVAEALRAYGSAVRGDWSDFDGRSCRDSLNTLADALNSPDEVSYESLCRSVEVCPVSRSWPEYCPETSGWSCPHMTESPRV